MLRRVSKVPLTLSFKTSFWSCFHEQLYIRKKQTSKVPEEGRLSIFLLWRGLEMAVVLLEMLISFQWNLSTYYNKDIPISLTDAWLWRWCEDQDEFRYVFWLFFMLLWLPNLVSVKVLRAAIVCINSSLIRDSCSENVLWKVKILDHSCFDFLDGLCLWVYIEDWMSKTLIWTYLSKTWKKKVTKLCIFLYWACAILRRWIGLWLKQIFTCWVALDWRFLEWVVIHLYWLQYGYMMAINILICLFCKIFTLVVVLT